MKWKGVLLGRKRNELYKKSHSSKTKMAFQVGGVGGFRTLVQTRNNRAFYMFISQLIFDK